MVSHEQRNAVTRTVIGAGFTLALLAAPSRSAKQTPKKFYPDDPLLREPAPRPVKQRRQTGCRRHLRLPGELVRDAAHARARTRGKAPQPALDVNTLGDVPDSAWYTNRHYYRRMSIEELKRGPGNSTPPSPQGTWRVISGQERRCDAGLRHRGRAQEPVRVEARSAAISRTLFGGGCHRQQGILRARLQHAGELHRALPPRATLEFPTGVMWRDASGKKHPLTQPHPRRHAPRRNPRGPTALPRTGEPLHRRQTGGPFSYEGMRTDDPERHRFRTRTGASCAG